MNDKDNTDPNSRIDSVQALRSVPVTQRANDALPIDRREYLKYTSALAGGAVVASQGALATDREDGDGNNETSDRFAVATNLQVDYEREPNNLSPAIPEKEADEEDGTTVAVPHLTWKVAGPKGVEQSAYRVLVATSLDDLENGRGDVWDSGRVKSSRSINVPYEGLSLEPDTTYHWMVRLWDSNGNAGKWSEPTTFATAIPDTDEHWSGEWIGPEYEESSLPGADWTDYTFEAEFTIVEGAAGFVFHASGTENLYMWQIILGSHPSFGETALRPHVWKDGNPVVLEDIPLEDVLRGEEHERHLIEIDIVEDEITTSIDGTVVDSRTDSTHSSGSIGFRTDGASHAHVHTVTVTNSVNTVLFADDFSAPRAKNFTGGTIEDGALSLNRIGFVLRGDPFDRPSPLLRREVELDGEIANARLHVSGIGFHELYINGERVGNRVLEPGISDYEETVLYSTYDVTDYLTTGENAIGVALGRGWYGLPTENTWNWHEAPWWSDPQLLLQCSVDFEDGTDATIVSDENWAMTDGPTRFGCLFAGEVYDAREKKPGWTEPDYDDSKWKDATTTEAPGGSLTPQRVQPVKVTDTFEPVEMSEPKDGIYVFDMGQMIAGWPELTVEGLEGTEVTVAAGETLHEDGTVNVDNSFIRDTVQTNSYILSGDGVETWEPRFTYHGFRYVQVEGFPGEPSTDAIQAKVLHTVVEESVRSDFECSNALLDQIHENTRWAMLNNLHGVHTDSPFWEKAGWTETNIEMGPSLMYNFWMPRFWKKFLRDAEDEQRKNGMISYLLPTSGWGYGEYGYANDPGWDAAICVVPWKAYEFYSDERFLADHYEVMKRYVEFVRNDSDDHIVWTGLGDYIAPGYTEPPEGGGIVSTSLYYRSAQIVADAAELLGYDADRTKFRKLCDEIRKAFNEEFFDPNEKIYRTGEVNEYRQTSNVYPLAFGLVPEGNEIAVVENLANNVMTVHDGHLDVGAHGLQHLLPVLTRYGHLDVAYTIATRTTYPSWGLWIEEHGVTALLEMWDPDRARSHTHDFLGSIDQWFYQYLAGIEPAAPGFEQILIKPYVPGDLESAGATTDTVRGTVASHWERVETLGGRERDGLSLEVTIPGNSAATVEIPTLGSEKLRVREDGKTIWNDGNRTRPNHPGIEDVTWESERIVVEVGSGAYEFELEQLNGD